MQNSPDFTLNVITVMGEIASDDHNAHIFTHNVVSIMNDFVVFMGEIVSVDHNNVSVMGDYVAVMSRLDSVMSVINGAMGKNEDFAHNAVVITHTFNDFD